MSFSDFANKNLAVNTVVEQLGYQFQNRQLDFAASLTTQQQKDVEILKQKTQKRLAATILKGEQAKREILIIQIIFQLFEWIDFKYQLEYPVEVSDQLKGKLDYILWGQKDLVVFEAKNDDFDGGANQLAAEMIAVAQTENQDFIHGAVTNGILWQFYQCDCPSGSGEANHVSNVIVQDINFYSFPRNGEELLGILLKILSS